MPPLHLSAHWHLFQPPPAVMNEFWAPPGIYPWVSTLRLSAYTSDPALQSVVMTGPAMIPSCRSHHRSTIRINLLRGIIGDETYSTGIPTNQLNLQCLGAVF